MTSNALSSALVSALQAGRSLFNARVAAMCRSQPGFDTAGVQTLLSGPLDRLAVLAEAIDAARTNSLLLSAFDAGLTLQARGKSELPVVQAIWHDVLPACLPLALRQPREVLGRLFNAALNLQALGGAREQQWTQDMTRLAGRCDGLDSLSGLGQLLAWRCGAAHFRRGALAVARRLPAELVLDALASVEGGAVSDVLARLECERWFDPASPRTRGLRAVHEVGGYSGFGGPFSMPPEVRALADGFAVRGGDRYWFLCADAFGAILHAGSADEFAAGQNGAEGVTWQEGEVCLGTQRCALDLPADGVCLVRGEATLAVTSPDSHFIRLLALP